MDPQGKLLLIRAWGSGVCFKGSEGFSMVAAECSGGSGDAMRLLADFAERFEGFGFGVSRFTPCIRSLMSCCFCRAQRLLHCSWFAA